MQTIFKRPPTDNVSLAVDIFLVVFLASLFSAIVVSQCFIRF